MDRESINLFAARFGDFAQWTANKQADYLAYYLLSRDGVESVIAQDIEAAFDLLDLKPHSRLNKYLSEETTKKGGHYIKREKGYRLERATSDSIRAIVDAEPTRVHVAKELSDLVPKIKDSQERLFLEEAIRCYRVESYRATIVMVWVLTMDHLQNYVFGNKLTEFNAALSAHGDKRMKPIVAYDDFSELKEVRIIELMRSAGIISNDVRKILDEKLGTRNSAGHPSGIMFSGHKTTEFALDLLQNVLLKY